MSATLFETAGISNENDEWYTPSWFWPALGVFFDLDPCSPGAPPSTVPAKRHVTKAENGLAIAWHGSVWLNPPFSSKGQWYKRLVEHGDGIALIPAATDTAITQYCMAAAEGILFLKGRVAFERGGGARGDAPPFGIVLCAYGHPMARVLLDSQQRGVVL